MRKHVQCYFVQLKILEKSKKNTDVSKKQNLFFEIIQDEAFFLWSFIFFAKCSILDI